MASVYHSLSLLCIVSICFRMTISVPLNSFFPFGQNNEDTILAKGDNENKDLILTHNFVFFTKPYQMVNIRTKGVLIPGSAVNAGRFPDGAFPLSNHLPAIAPFWGDVDTTGAGGEVYYRVTNNANIVQKVKDIVTKGFPIESEFTAKEVIVATWDHVGYFDQQNDQVNTFQCVVATDGTRTFSIYLYLDNGINWYYIRIPAQAGFEAGDGVNYLLLEGSNTDDVVDIDEKSNVDIPGLFVFQINDIKIRSPGDPTCPVVGTAACKYKITQIACQLLNSTVATVSELPLQCQQILST